MSDSTQLTITILLCVTSVIVSLINLKRINQIRIDIDGRLQEFMNIYGKAEKAKGHLEGKAEEKAENNFKIDNK